MKVSDYLFICFTYWKLEGHLKRTSLRLISRSCHVLPHFLHREGVTKIWGTVFDLTVGLHGFHIHEKGQLGNNCKDSGGHFNPAKVTHGAPTDEERHAGDLGNIMVYNPKFTRMEKVY